MNKKKTEKEIENEILHFLNSRPNTFAWKVNNGAIYDKDREDFRIKSKFDLSGQADITCITEGGTVYFFEVKTETGKESAKQKAFQKKIISLGGRYFFVRSVEDVEDIL